MKYHMIRFVVTFMPLFTSRLWRCDGIITTQSSLSGLSWNAGKREGEMMFEACAKSQDTASIREALISVVGSYTQDALRDAEQRRQHKEQCAERLAAEDNVEVHYAEQAVLANLDWGIDALEEAILTSNTETLIARLQHAEKMLQVCALLDSHHSTAGVPNSYLSAWAHLNLAFVWKLRAHDQHAAAHMLEMFIVDPFYSRVDFAPRLWEQLFLPHLTSVVSWYTEQRHKIFTSVLPADAPDVSYSRDDLDLAYNDGTYKNLLSNMGPEQAEELQELEKLYQDSLDDNTRLYARFYKDWLKYDPSVNKKKNMPLMPIAEPPMTPLHESSCNLQSSIKYGPQLSKSSGFSQNIYEDINMIPSNKSSVRYADNRDKSENSVNYSKVHTHPMWEEEQESEEITSSVAEKLYKVDMEIMLDGNTRWLPDHPETAKAVPRPVTSSLHRSIDTKHDSKDNFVKEYPSQDKISPSLVPTSIKKNTKLGKQKSTKGRASMSKPLMELFRSQESAMISSPQSISSFEESLSSFGSELQVEEGLQKSYIDTSVRLRERYDAGRDNDQNEESAELIEEENKADSCFRSPLSLQGDYSSALVDSIDVPNQNLSPLKLSEMSTPTMRPPKDFVCSITSQLFNDPVTLETGQTYERKAIQEWLDRGNTTCPITRQTLKSTTLPKTNYVLKRLIASWKEQHPGLASEFGSVDNSPGPSTPPNVYVPSQIIEQTTLPEVVRTPKRSLDSPPFDSPNNIKGRFTERFGLRSNTLSSPLSEASLRALVSEVKPAISCLCSSDDLQECEAAISTIARIWHESKADPRIQAYLAKAPVIKGFMEVLPTSIALDIQMAALYILSELIVHDDSVGQMILNEDPELDHMVGLFKRGVLAAAVLLYQLKPSSSQLAFHGLFLSLVSLLRESEEISIFPDGSFPICISLKEAAVVLIDQMLADTDETTKSSNAQSIISVDGLSALVDSLESSSLDERMSAVSVLLCCMQADGGSRNYIAHRAQLVPVLELLHSGSARAQTVTILFLSELVQLNRRTVNNQILQIIKEEGILSTMHTLLVQLQMAPLEHRPLVAGLLLQLDILTEPRKRSMYREEAVEALVDALSKEDLYISQVAAAETIVSLGGRFSYFGEPLMEPTLLKLAGLSQSFDAIMKAELHANESPEVKEEEENAAKEWEKRMAGALANYENGAIFEALAKGTKSKKMELSRPCMVATTWLVHLLHGLPDTGVHEKARSSTMHVVVDVLESANDIEGKALAALALHSFVQDPEGMQELVKSARDICRTLRKLKKNLWMANMILKALMNNPCIVSPEFWVFEELGPPIDATMCGEVRSLASCRGLVFSGHSDGVLKVWDGKRKMLHPIQDLKEHTKSVTCLSIASGDKLFSGSLDKTIRVWAIGPEEIHCLQVHDVKEPVLNLCINSTMCSYVPQGTGVKIYHWEHAAKLLNGNKHVQSIAMANGKLFCGCTDNSVQELDLEAGSTVVVQHGVRILLGKKAIYALQVLNGLLYTAGSPVDGVAAKVWNLSDRSVVGHLPTTLEVRAMAVNDELIYLGSSSGMIEVWLRERLVKVATLHVGSKVTALLINGDILYCGAEDGKMRAWELH